MGELDIQEFYFTNSRQQKLFGLSVAPQDTSKIEAVLVFNHGYAEHCSRKLSAFKQLAAAGIMVYALDMASFGRSEPTEYSQRALIWSYEHLADDLCWFAEVARKRHAEQQLPLVPWFVGGFSLGGLTAAHAVLRHQDLWRGMVLVSGCFWVEMTWVTQVQRAVAPLLVPTIPTVQIVQKLDPAHDLNPDLEQVQDYCSDPLVYRENTRVITAYQMGLGILEMKKLRKTIDLPVYAVHATLDNITPYKDMEEFMRAISSVDKKFVTVQGGYHDLIGGKDTATHVAGITSWILEHARPQTNESHVS